MTETALVPAETELVNPDPAALVALTPAGEAAQQHLVAWCDHRLATLRAEKKDAEENYAIAKKAKWRSQPWLARARKAKRQITYYEKVRSALTQGFVLVPNFPGELFALRVGESASPPGGETTNWRGPNPPAGQGLPEGKGRNVAPPAVLEERRDQPDGRGTDVIRFFADEYDEELAFPMVAVKPVILNAAQHALALKLFDQLVVGDGGGQDRRQRGDPMLLGRIYDPTRKHYGPGHFVTFFLGWWMDPRAI